MIVVGWKAEQVEAEASAARRSPRVRFVRNPFYDGLRELARHTFVEAADALATIAEERGDPAEAVRHRLRILDVDPYDEAAHLGMIRSLSAQRRHGEARRAYRTYCMRLAELDLDPAPFPH